MAGLAANVDDQWRESIRHLRDIARENEERLETNRELVGRLAIITPALTDGHAGAVPQPRPAPRLAPQTYYSRNVRKTCERAHSTNR